MTHFAHLRSPKLMAPRIGTDTLKPLLPSCLYSAVMILEPSLAAMVVKVRSLDFRCAAPMVKVDALARGSAQDALLIKVIVRRLLSWAAYKDSVDVGRCFMIWICNSGTSPLL